MTPAAAHGPAPGAQAVCCPECALHAEWQRVGSSPLFASGGARAYRGLIDAATHAALWHEATTQVGRSDSLPEGHDPERVRGGAPARCMVSVEGGPVQSALFGSRQLAGFIGGEVRMPVRACGQAATYTIYQGPGAHLALHRDVTGCDLTLITCLWDDDPHAGGGALETWPAELMTPLDELRARADREPGTRIALEPGDSLLIHGGMVPHRVTALGAGRTRVVSVMCFGICG